jgi:hypothetical protein
MKSFITSVEELLKAGVQPDEIAKMLKVDYSLVVEARDFIYDMQNEYPDMELQ